MDYKLFKKPVFP